jgi:hypothetical protein
LQQGPAFVRVVSRHHPDVGVVVGIVADKGDEAAVFRPGRLRIVVVPRGDLGHFLGGHVEDVKMGTAAVQVSFVIHLELEPVNDLWWWSLGLEFLSLFFSLLGSKIFG